MSGAPVSGTVRYYITGFLLALCSIVLSAGFGEALAQTCGGRLSVAATAGPNIQSSNFFVTGCGSISGSAAAPSSDPIASTGATFNFNGSFQANAQATSSAAESESFLNVTSFVLANSPSATLTAQATATPLPGTEGLTGADALINVTITGPNSFSESKSITALAGGLAGPKQPSFSAPPPVQITNLPANMALSVQIQADVGATAETNSNASAMATLNASFSPITLQQAIDGAVGLAVLPSLKAKVAVPALSAIGAFFTPNFSLTLQQAAAIGGFDPSLGVDGFDFIQTVTADPVNLGSYLHGPTAPIPGWIDYNTLPLSYSPNLTPAQYGYCGSGFTCPTFCGAVACATNPTSLVQFDEPFSSCFSPQEDCISPMIRPSNPLQELVFNTELVGLFANGTDEPLVDWSWESNYSGSDAIFTSGGASILCTPFTIPDPCSANAGGSYFDDGGGSGGVTLLSETYLLDQTPTAVDQPSTLPLFAAGLGGLALLRWRRKQKARAGVA